MKVKVYWITKNPATIKKIRDKFSLPYYTTISGETVGEVKEELMDLLKECEKKGFLKIRFTWNNEKRNA